MAAETERTPIVLRPRQVPQGSKRWVEWIDQPRDRVARDAYGCLATAFGFLLAAALIVVYTRAQNHGSVGGIAMALFAGAGALVKRLFRHSRRIRAPHALDTLKQDRRSPLLLLRAFRDDFQPLPGYLDYGNALTFNQGAPKTFEELLYDLFSPAGPVIAIARPSDRTPPLGAARFWVRHSVWRQVVDEILQEAQYVVLVMSELCRTGTICKSGVNGYLTFPPGVAAPLDDDAERHVKQFLVSLEANVSRPPEDHAERDVKQFLASLEGSVPADADDGLAWEANRLFGLDDYQKVILIMPPVDEADAARRWQEYRELSHGLLPAYEGGEIAATFGADRTCRVARVKKYANAPIRYVRDAQAYRELVKVLAS